MNKTLAIIIPVVFLIIFGFFFNSGDLLKKPMGESDDVASRMSILEANITGEEWKEAKESLSNVKEAWHKVIPRIQFSVERDEVNRINRLLSRIEGAINAQDKASALLELSETKEQWGSLGR